MMPCIPTTRAFICIVLVGSILANFAVCGSAISCPEDRVLIDPPDSDPYCGCQAGFYSETSDTVVACFACRPGTFSSEPGQDQCEFCPRNQYQPNMNSTLCLSCLGNSETVYPGSSRIEECICLEGFYGSDSICSVCPREGAICPGGTKFPLSIKGYWRDISNPQNPRFYKCIPSDACLGVENDIGSNLCSEGYEGDQCGICSGGFYRNGSKCVQCRENAKALFGFFIFLMFVIAYLTLLVSTPDSSKFFSSGIILSWLQIVALFQGLKFKLPESVQTVLNALSIFNFNLNIFAPECSIPVNYWSKWLLKLSAPFCFLAILALIAFIHLIGGKTSSLLRRLFTGRKVGPDPYASSRYIYALLSLTITLYTNLTSTGTEPFNCIKQPESGRYIMLNNPSEFCFEGEWMKNIPTAATFSALYILGIPFGVFLLIFFHRKTLFSHDSLAKFGTLIMPYRMEAYYWEVFTLTRRAVIVCLIDFLTQFNLLYVQVILLLFNLSITLVLQVLVRPYALESNNHLSFLWNATAIIFIFAGAIFHNTGSEFGMSEEEGLLLQGILFLFLGISVLYSFKALWIEHRSSKRINEYERLSQMTHYEMRNYQHAYIKKTFPHTHKQVWTKFAYSGVEVQMNFFLDCEALNPNKDGQDLLTRKLMTKKSAGETVNVDENTTSSQTNIAIDSRESRLSRNALSSDGKMEKLLVPKSSRSSELYRGDSKFSNDSLVKPKSEDIPVHVVQGHRPSDRFIHEEHRFANTDLSSTQQGNSSRESIDKRDTRVRQSLSSTSPNNSLANVINSNLPNSQPRESRASVFPVHESESEDFHVEATATPRPSYRVYQEDNEILQTDVIAQHQVIHPRESSTTRGAQLRQSLSTNSPNNILANVINSNRPNSQARESWVAVIPAAADTRMSLQNRSIPDESEPRENSPDSQTSSKWLPKSPKF